MYFTDCGNGICENDESPKVCPVDCILCGDGKCNTGEDKYCYEDCHHVCSEYMSVF